MSKIEKTLELNITHEILSLADSFWWFLYDVRLWKYWKPNKIPFGMPRPTPFASGLPISVEGDPTKGGYDVKLEWHGPGGPHRAAFLQFKAGTDQKYCLTKKSQFYRGKSRSAHVLFKFNNNGSKNQHSILQGLAKSHKSDSVLYVFPRIASESHLKDKIGRLYLSTTFISIKDLDKKAAKNGITIKDGTEHKFRACYDNYKRNEVNKYFYFYDEPDVASDFLAELIAVRVMKSIRHFQSENLLSLEARQEILTMASLRTIFHLLNYFNLQLIEESARIQQTLSSQKVKSELGNLTSQNEATLAEGITRTRTMFYTVLYQLNPYFTICDNPDLPVPDAPSNFSFDINENGVTHHFDEKGLLGKDFSDINFLVF
jgi:hypothetical protein